MILILRHSDRAAHEIHDALRAMMLEPEWNPDLVYVKGRIHSIMRGFVKRPELILDYSAGIVEGDEVLIHGVKKEDGTDLMVDDLADDILFGNGVSVGEVRLKDGKRVAATWICFPTRLNDTVRGRLADIEGLI